MSVATFDRTTVFRDFVEPNLDYVWSALLRLGVRSNDAEDVLHDLLLEVHAKLDRWESDRPIRPWLFRFAFRAACQHRRKLGRRREWVGDVDVMSTEPTVDQRFSDAQQAELVRRALDELDEDKRAILIAYELDELPMKEIAHALGIPLNTAYSRLRHGREELGRRLRQRGLSEAKQ